MRIIEARNVNGAWLEGAEMLLVEGVLEQSSRGVVLALEEPVTTVYESPEERALFCPVRAANPFFHLFESMWMLSGSSDARWLDRWVHDFSDRFAEPSGHMHGAYGQRWRKNFYVRTPDQHQTCDQLRAVATLLAEEPTTRQAVLSMWDPSRDLCLANVRDRPCNTHCYFRVLRGHLNMTVLCRSNDIVWGAYGANAVHMSVMQEFVAVWAGLRMGSMWQVSNNWHGYTEVLNKMTTIKLEDHDLYEQGEVTASSLFRREGCASLLGELILWMRDPCMAMRGTDNQPLFDDLLVPMANVHALVVSGLEKSALDACESIRHSDWRRACQDWVQRRLERRG